MNCKNRFDNRSRSPYNDFYGLPRSNMLASLSISSTIYRVKLQSHYFTVHFVFNKISSLSSVEMFFILSPLYKSMSYLARIVNGVWTSVTLPSVLLSLNVKIPFPLFWITHGFQIFLYFLYFLIFSSRYFEPIDCLK
jgi:hypothetical protein